MSSTSSTTSSAASFYTSNGVTKMNGSELMSGLDTDTLITELTSNTQSKIDKQKQLLQIAEWKQQMYQDVDTQTQDFYNTYLSYASSDTNILSKAFFESGQLTSSSSAVTATGNASDAGNVIINNITQLASAASVYSSQQVSDESITSGAIEQNWTASAVGGHSMIINYAGEDYKITLSSSVSLSDSDTASETADKIVDGLNAQIEANTGLNGKVEFCKVGNDTDGYSLQLNVTGSGTATVKDYESGTGDTSGTQFLSALGLTADSSGSTVTGGVLDTDPTTSLLFNKTISSSSYLNLTVGSEAYTLKLGSDIDVSKYLTSGSLDSASLGSAIASALQQQVDADTALNGVVTVSADTSGNISFSSSGDTISVTGGSQNLLNGLGLAGQSGTSFTGTLQEPELIQSNLGDTLSGSTLTVSLDGVSKTLTFNASEQSQYSDAAGLQTYLQSKLNSSFGSGKVNVALNGSSLVLTTSDSTSVLAMSSASKSGVLGSSGALHITAGETNRIETSKTLEDLSGELNVPLDDSTDTYSFTINNKSFTFDKTATLSSVISAINSDSDANVTVTYSQTSNQFRITSDDTGSQSAVAIYDNSGGGNLAEALFGANYAGLSGVNSQDLTVAADGSVTTGASDSAYTFQLGSGTAQTVTLAGNATYASMQELADALRDAVNSNSTLAGNVSVNVSSDGKQIYFGSEDGSTSLTVAAQDAGSDFLGIGTAGVTSASVDDSKTLADLYSEGVSGISQDVSGNYTIGGVSGSFSGDTVLNSLGYNGVSEGSDLKMNVTLGAGGTATDITRSTNSFTLDGISLTAADTTDEKVTFSSVDNTDDLCTKITDFINAYNKIIDTVNTYTSDQPDSDYQPLTDSQKATMTDDEITKWNDEAKKGLLQNDSLLNGILSNLRSTMMNAVSGSGLSLNDIGISTIAYDWTSGGQLVVDQTKLKNALENNLSDVEDLFTGTSGVAANVQNVLTNYIGGDGSNTGLLVERAGKANATVDTSEMASTIQDYNTRIDDLTTQLSDEKTRWETKFTTMETSLVSLNSQYTFLSSMLSGS